MRARAAIAAVLVATCVLSLASTACDARETRTRPTRAERARAKVAPPVRALGPEDVSFVAPDGTQIHATLRRDTRRDAPAVVLVHQLSHDRREWSDVVSRLRARPGLAVLAIDLRGHGQSIRHADGTPLEHARMSPSDWAATETDVLAAVAYVRPGGGARLAAPRVAIVGSSIGSSAAIRAAVRDPSVVAVAALSPGRAYRGVDAIEPLRRWGSRKLWVLATARDVASAEAAHDMLRVVPRSQGRIADGRAHGLAMTAEVPGILDEIEGFVREALDAP